MILRWLFALTIHLQSSQDYWNAYLVANSSFKCSSLGMFLSLDKHSSAIGREEEMVKSR